MIFDQNLNFNRVTIIIIRIFYKLIWWFPQIFSQCHETFLILKVTDLRCLLKETDCVRILASHSYGVVVSRPPSLCLAGTNVTMVDILIQLFSFLRCLKSVIFKIRWDSSYWINITKRPIIWKLFFLCGALRIEVNWWFLIKTFKALKYFLGDMKFFLFWKSQISGAF